LQAWLEEGMSLAEAEKAKAEAFKDTSQTEAEKTQA